MVSDDLKYPGALTAYQQKCEVFSSFIDKIITFDIVYCFFYSKFMSNSNNKKSVVLNDAEFMKYKTLNDIMRELKNIFEQRGATNVDIESSLNTCIYNTIKGELNFDGQHIEFNFIPHREGITDFNMFIDGKSVYEGKVMKWGSSIVNLILQKSKSKNAENAEIVNLSNSKKINLKKNY